MLISELQKRAWEFSLTLIVTKLGIDVCEHLGSQQSR